MRKAIDLGVNVYRDSIYQLKLSDNGRVLDQNGFEFDASSYSQFKHGREEIAMDYGSAISNLLVRDYPNIIFSDKNLIVLGTPYVYEKPAASSIEMFLLSALGPHRARHGLSPAKSMCFRRTESIAGDYSTLDTASRENQLNREIITIDTLSLFGANLIIIDDIRITGSGESRLWKELKFVDFVNCCFIYVAEIDPEDAKNDPTIESRINESKVCDLIGVDVLIDFSASYRINARVTKMLLKQRDFELVKWFLSRRSKLFIFELAHIVLGSQYYRHDVYVNNSKYLLSLAVSLGLVDPLTIPFILD